MFSQQKDSPVVVGSIVHKDSIQEDCVKNHAQQQDNNAESETKGKDLQRQLDKIRDANKTGGTDTTNNAVSGMPADSSEPKQVTGDDYESPTPNVLK